MFECPERCPRPEEGEGNKPDRALCIIMEEVRQEGGGAKKAMTECWSWRERKTLPVGEREYKEEIDGRGKDY
jgi:hypothetical protein